MKLAVQIIPYKSSREIAPLLASLRQQTLKDFEVWFYDTSEDAADSAASRALVEQAGLNSHYIVAEKNIGFAGGHEAMFHLHDAPLVMLLNYDAKLEPKYLEEVVRRMESDPKIGSVTGLVYRWREDGKHMVDTAGLEYKCLGKIVDRFAGETVPDQELQAREVFGVSGAIGLYRRSAVEKAGGLFDPSWFMYKEDADLAIRLRRAGFTAWLEPQAVAWHKRGLKEEERGIVARLKNERARPARLRQYSYVNQWRIYQRYWKSIGWKDRLDTVRAEFLRSAMVFLASPKVFAGAWRVILRPSPPYEGGARGGSRGRDLPPPLLRKEGRNGTLPKIGIIYLTYPMVKWERDINGCLTSLEKLNYPKDRLELICVESKGKIAPVKEWFERTWMPKSGVTLPRISYIFKDEWIGFSGNNNLGLEKAKELGCEYVHLTNEDTDVDPDYLIRAVERAEADPTIGVVQSLILLGEERDKANSTGNAFHYLGFGYSSGYKERVSSIEYRVSGEIGYASGAAALVRMAALEGRPLFDEKFSSYHEDTDLCLRLRTRGWKTVIEPRSILWHYYEFGKNKINYYWMERNRYVLMFSYYRPWTLLVLFPMVVVMDIAILAFSIKNGWFDMKGKMYRDLFSRDFWRWIKDRRKQIQAERLISDRELLRLAVSTIEFQEDAVKNPLLDYVGNPLLRAYWWVAKRLI
jgi:GT2 family glycosyltransferase